jgi:hypothetical protein
MHQQALPRRPAGGGLDRRRFTADAAAALTLPAAPRMIRAAPSAAEFYRGKTVRITLPSE